jgi:hypothetical protein
VKQHKEVPEGEESIPLKVKRLRTKQENKQKAKLHNLLRDSRSASEIAQEAEDDDGFLAP